MIRIRMRHVTVVALTVILSLTYTVDACFPSKYWISCLIDSCKLGGKCPGDPAAQCKMEKTPCNGCKPRWYTKSGEKAHCGARKDLKLCPRGEPVVHCKVDSCRWPCSHPDFRSAACRQSYCGECAAEYFIKDTWVSCPVSSTGTAGEKLPIDNVLSDSCLKVPCDIKICMGQKCPAVHSAVCRPDGCNGCKAAWFMNNRPVNCKTGEFITNKPGFEPIVKTVVPPWQRTCAKYVPLTPCDMKVCDKKICRNFPNAVCRPDGCGGCKDTWYVDNKLMDCFSDECPPKVPFVKCVDDPCKYFGHYCPAAECRASQCGKCEAKFFVDGQEIDCTMPPKECPAGVKPRICPWYTCPANICPSNKRLMCRIDPCGSRCKYNFIDIYNGESRLCRVFDGDGRPSVDPSQNSQTDITFTDVTQTPHLGNLVSPDIGGFGLALPQSVDTTHMAVNDNAQGISLGQANLSPTGESSDTGGNGGINVQPFFTNPGPPIVDPDLLALLRSFPHEMVNVPSASITTALKKNTPIVGKAESQTQNMVPVKQQVDQGITIRNIENPKPKQVFQDPVIHKPKGEQSMKQFFNVNDNVIDNQLLDIAAKDTSIYPELLGGQTKAQQLPKPARKPEPLIPSLEQAKQQSKPIYPELHNIAPSSIAAGKPSNINSHVMGGKSNKLDVKVSAPRKARQGVPISMHMFRQWGGRD